jgi:hypothetical protein
VLEVVKASPAWANEDVFSNYPSWALLAATSNASTLWGLQLGTREAVPLLNTLFGAAPKVWRLQVAPVVERVTQWATWQRTQAALAGGDPAAGGGRAIRGPGGGVGAGVGGVRSWRLGRM